MTDQERELLKASIDEVVLLTTAEGERLAQILFVFAGEETPDVFYVEVEERADGTFVPKGKHGHSTLLSDVLSVRRVPPKQG